MKVRPKKSIPEQNLSSDKVYTVIAISANDYRLVNDAQLPLLYAPELFEIVDPTEPECWVSENDSGYRYAGPKEFMAREPGFFEDYFDGVEGVRQVFWSTIEKYPELR